MAETLIAVVDDDDLVRNATASLLRSMGFSTRTFASADAFLKADQSDIRCVVSDHQMPGMSGLDLCEELARQPLPIPFILMTAFSLDLIRGRVNDCGAVAVLEKPVHAELLGAAVERALTLSF